MTFGFHPDAAREYEEAIRYYREINARLAASFILEIEQGIDAIRKHPLRWHLLADDVRRHLIRRFPFGIYYTCGADHVTIWALMHLNRKPGYWKARRRKT